MTAFDCIILVLQLVIIAIAGVIAAATRTRQEYNEYHGKLEEFPNHNSPWPLILVVVGSSLVLSGECFWALTFAREHALLFLSMLLLQGMATNATAKKVLAGYAKVKPA